jgi:RNA polymerase sigma-70 factor, ECF subfamily
MTRADRWLPWRSDSYSDVRCRSNRGDGLDGACCFVERESAYYRFHWIQWPKFLCFTMMGFASFGGDWRSIEAPWTLVVGSTRKSRGRMETQNADQYLVEQIRAGEQSAWRQLIGRYEGRLTAFARMRTASLSDAEDLAQETFVGFLQSLPHYDAKRTLETYLFTILRYKLCDRLRQRKIVPLHAPADSDDWWDQIMPAATDTPSGIAADAEARRSFESSLAELLRRLIHELRDRVAFDDLQVIELVFYKGMRNLHVAELLDIDQKSVAGIKFRAIQRLQKFLSEMDQVSGISEAEADVTVARVWREHRLTCLKRGTLGTFLLNVLEEPWNGYTQFHLDVVGCPMCLANLEDLRAEETEERDRSSASIFASSVGFLSRASKS